jgi:hypothetical protein
MPLGPDEPDRDAPDLAKPGTDEKPSTPEEEDPNEQLPHWPDDDNG